MKKVKFIYKSTNNSNWGQSIVFVFVLWYILAKISFVAHSKWILVCLDFTYLLILFKYIYIYLINCLIFAFFCFC